VEATPHEQWKNADVPNLLVRVWLPDRPGALGLVASRIGAIGGDIVGIDVLERSDRVAVDEFAVVLTDGNLIDLLIREIGEVDGASVVERRAVERFPDPRLDALEAVEVVCGADSARALAQQLVERVHAEFSADWAMMLRKAEVYATAGSGAPDPTVLDAIAAGTAASPAVAAGETGPDDLAVAPLTRFDAVLLVGRAGHPIRRRERQQLLALARIADRLSGMVDQGHNT
jgi:hypothetical protein